MPARKGSVQCSNSVNKSLKRIPGNHQKQIPPPLALLMKSSFCNYYGNKVYVMRNSLKSDVINIWYNITEKKKTLSESYFSRANYSFDVSRQGEDNCVITKLMPRNSSNIKHGRIKGTLNKTVT